MAWKWGTPNLLFLLKAEKVRRGSTHDNENISNKLGLAPRITGKLFTISSQY